MRRRPSTCAAAAAAAALLLAAVAPAAEAPRSIVSLAASVTPGTLPIPNGTPLTLRIRTTFASEPADADLVLQRFTFLFGHGARFNARMLPSCSVARLRAANGRLGACPRGSRIGSGVAVGTAVAIGLTSSARLTFFNGPGGRTVTMNVSVVNPALINETFSAQVQRLRGRYEFKLSGAVPVELQRVLDGDIVVKRFDVTAGATRLVDGRRRGYFEALDCPRDGSAIRGDFAFDQGVRGSDELTVVC